jgi:hypothetical protein
MEKFLGRFSKRDDLTTGLAALEVAPDLAIAGAGATFLDLEMEP